MDTQTTTPTKEAGHTPGPWIADGGARVQGADPGSMYDICHLDPIPPHVGGIEIKKANARLIAAAPDMLLALQAQEVASEFNEEGSNPRPNDPRYTRFIGEWDRLSAPSVRWVEFHRCRKALRRAAIAKALGTEAP